jgi:hypothetical protein
MFTTKKLMLTLMLLVPVCSQADDYTMYLKNYLNDKKIAKVTGFYAITSALAFEAANEDLLGRKQPALYCKPPKLELDNAGYLRILNNFLEQRIVKSPKIDELQNYPLQFFVLAAMEDAFPCSNSPEPTKY